MLAVTAPNRLLEAEEFENETFTGLDLQRGVLAGKEFYKCVFESCLLQETNWKTAKLESCVFRGCDLTRAQLLHTALRGVTFENSKLMGIDWSSVSPHPELKFTECNLRYASFVRVNLRKLSFKQCVVREANFIDTDLSDAAFTGSDLTGSNIQGCTLTATDFSGATGVFFEPSRNKVKKTRVATETAVLIAEHFGLLVSG